MIRILLLCFFGVAHAAHSFEFIEVPGKLSDNEFYKLLSCRAAPGQACRFEPTKWRAEDAKDLTISIYKTSADYLFPKSADLALDHAVSEINGVGADVVLRRLENGEDAHITVFLSSHKKGDTINGIGINAVDGNIMQGAYVHVFWNKQCNLTRGIIIFSADLDEEEITAVMLEEVTQALGLLTDIRSPWYETRSVFSEDSNLVTKPGRQDAMALRRHYPAAQ